MQKDGLTYRQHLEAVAERSEWARRELAGPEMPKEVSHIWRWFLDLHFGRACHASGAPMPITWEAMYAYSKLTGVRMRPVEVEMLRACDARWLAGVERPKPGERQ